MKVHYLTNELFPDVYRGGGVYARNVLEAMRENERVSFHLLTLKHRRDFNERNVTQVEPNWEIRNKITLFLAILLYFFKAIFCLMRRKPDLIHCNSVIETLIPIFLRKNFVFTLHDLAPLKIGKISKLIAYLAIRYSRAIFVTTKWMEDNIKSTFESKLVFNIPNAINVDRYRSSSVEEKKTVEKHSEVGGKDLVLFVGALEKHKGVDTLLRSFDKVREERKDVLLLLVGNSENADDGLIHRLEKLKEEKKCIHFEKVSNKRLRELYSISDVFVLPSKELEGQGIVLMEAMASGTPVIASNLPVFIETAGSAGVFVDPNSIEDITKTITRILNNRGLRKKLSERSKEKAKEYDITRFKKRLEKSYRKINLEED